jgi:hypothetical protein
VPQNVKTSLLKLIGKIGTAGMLFLFLCLSAGKPSAAYAQGPVAVVSDLPASIARAIDAVKATGTKSLTAALVTYGANMMTYISDRLAYDAAVFISSGGSGESPLFDNRNIGEYFVDFGKGVGGEAVGLLNNVTKDTGVFSNFNLCAPTNPDVLLAFKFGIKSVYERPEPVCDWDEIGSNWNGFLAKISSSAEGNVFRNKAILTQLANAYDPSVNEFSVGLQLYSDVVNQSNSESTLNATAQIKNDGFKSVTDAITGKVKTPADVLKENLRKRLEEPEETRKDIGIGTLFNKDILLALGTRAGSVFANTLLSSLTQKIYNGLFDFENPDFDPFNPSDFALSNGDNARNSYRSLLTSAPLEITNYSILDDFTSCPQEGRGLYNCVADGSFVSAISRADSGAPLTIAEAVDEGLLDGNWPLISSADHARDQDPYCYTYGYCYSNLVKLRKARVISIGWELAANSPDNATESPATLKEVLDGFDDCSASGESNSDHPWCKLIDPNWVLKYPETQCRAEVYGQLLSTSAADERQSECVDMPSCISEDDNGTCTGGYGYCVREENIWRFRGESCEAQYASCITVQNDEKTASYLSNTTDPGPCTADNAGCQWYATEKEEQTDGSFAYEAIPSIAAADVQPDAYQDRIYFTSAVEDCAEDDAGCKEVIERTDSLRLNLITNSGFESDTDNNAFPDAWTFTTGASWKDDSTGSRSGHGAVRAGTGTITEPGVGFSQSRFYTVSFYASGTDTARMMVAFSAEDGSRIDLSGTSASDSCQFSDENGDGFTDAVFVSGTPAGTTHERFTCTFTSPTQASSAARLFADVTISGAAYVDDVQIEQGETVSAYHEGYSSTDVVTSVVKVPPSYLGCTGASTDPAECANYAKVCSENDVGCTAYTPGNGDPDITGVATALDYCPGVCVGYDTFKEEPTRYEPQGEFPVAFIPDTAETCSEEEVGCDEFTNLSDESKEYFTYLRACVTPEQADANTSSDNAGIFYTWEGSDTEGYQLKTWSLLESNLGSSTYTYGGSGETDTDPGAAPCVNFLATDDGISCSDALDTDGDGSYDWDIASCDEHADILSNPDCREFYDVDGGIHYRSWSETVTVDAQCSAYRKTSLAGTDATEQESNCEESGGYYDGANGSCRYYGFVDQSVTCSEEANGCREYTGGRSRNSRVAFEDTLEDGTINNWDASSASTITYSNESLATDGHSIAATAPFETFAFDNGSDCTTASGCAGSAKSLGGSCTVINGERYCGTLENELYTGKTYTLSFWAKGTGTLESGFDFRAGSGVPAIEATFGSVSLTTGWQRYSVGPLDMNADDYAAFGSGSALAFIPSGTVYVDNVTLREGEENITVIKDSWVTPASCDQSPDGADSPGYYLGCEEYSTQTGETANLKSFSRLCDASEVGCENFYLTQESDSPYAEVHNAFCSTLDGGPATSATSCYYGVTGTTTKAYDTSSQYLCTIGVGETNCAFNLDWYVSPDSFDSHLSYEASTVVTPADTDAFLVVTDEVTCASGAEGCTEFGKPIYAQDRNSTTGADSVYLMNDPDKYDDILCKNNELFCSEWSGSNSTKYYFKDPGDQTCEYRTDVTVSGSQYDGWFRTGTNNFCYGTCSDGVTSCSSNADCGSGTCNAADPSYVINGNYSGVWKNGDGDYGGWVGTCTSENDSCTEFQDPLDAGSEIYGQADGKSYFFLNNENLDENSLPGSQQCNGKVSLKDGCSLFMDTGLSSENYQSSATEMASRHADALFGTGQFDLVDPIDCESGNSTITAPDGSTIDLCASRCVYDAGRLADISDGSTAAEKMTAGVSDPDELYVYGTSCYAASDCSPIKSESGEMVNASDCGTTVKTDLSTGTAAVDRLTNDTNTVLKVNRDRQCSEWLSCADSQTVWDERTNSYRTICGDVELCTEYSSLGNSSFCSQWKNDDPEVVLSAERYTERDVTWHGDEYSGYAIPDLFPVQTLSQADVSPPKGFCELTDALAENKITQDTFDRLQGASCSRSSDCVTAISDSCVMEDVPDYRLVLNAGSCEQDYGQTCSVGTCSKTGAACASANSCGTEGGDCVVGACYTLFPASLCTSDSNCTTGQVCGKGGFCELPGADVIIDGSFDSANPGAACASGQTFVKSVGYKNGSCMRGSCLLTPDGEQFANSTAEEKACRAYPEINSPFSSDIVEEWYDTDSQKKGTDANLSVDDVAYNTRSGFENAQFCAPGEVCECSYKKVEYGQSAATRYFAKDEDIETGICTSGKIGAACSDDAACNSTDTEMDGTCELPTKENTFLGQDGFCLERDSATNINGDRDENACITWLPVDQLAGSTDLYAKYTEAGFSEEANYCSSMTLYADVQTGQGCVERDKGAGSMKLECVNQATTCPPGTYGIIGPWAASTGSGDDLVDECSVVGVEDNDCAYVCVPLGATTKSGALSGGSCDWATVQSKIGPSGVESIGTIDRGDYSFDAYFVEDVETFSELRDAVGSCIAQGIRYAEIQPKDDSGGVFGGYATTFGLPPEGTEDCDDKTGGQCGWRNYLSSYSPYMACEEMAQVQNDADYSGAPWTDRLQNLAAGYKLSTGAGYESFRYSKATITDPFGRAPSIATMLGREWPAVIAQCWDSSTKTFSAPEGDPASPTCPAGTTPVEKPVGTSLKDTESRAFADFSGSQLSVGTYFKYIPDFSIISPVVSATSGVKDILSQIFAKSVGRLIYHDGISEGNLSDGFTFTADPDGEPSISTEDSSLVPGGLGDGDEWNITNKGNPPTVWALKTDKCSGTECEEGTPNAVTINSSGSGDQSEEGFFRAYMKFYAAADKNQLPLRRVIVDWGDGQDGELDTSGSADDQNFFKNHRGLQNGSTNSKCDLESEWGLTSLSCDPNYFSYSHIYTCSATLIQQAKASTDDTYRCQDLDGDGALDHSPCVNNEDDVTAVSCSFQPRVHARDNWGWCTGTCTAGTTDKTNGCFDGDGDINNPDPSLDECLYSNFTSSTGTTDPWVYYDGAITVKP